VSDDDSFSCKLFLNLNTNAKVAIIFFTSKALNHEKKVFDCTEMTSLRRFSSEGSFDSRRALA